MKRTPRNLLIIIVVLSLLISLGNYVNSSKNLDDLAYVMAIAFDVGTSGKYKISLQLSTIESSASESMSSSSSSSGGSSGGGESSGGGGSSEQQTQQYVINTMDCETLDMAINIANAFTNKDISLSHCKILVISEKLAQQGVQEIVNSLINKVELRPDCNIIIAKTPSGEFTEDSEPKLEELISKYYDVASNNETGIGYTKGVKLSDFYSNMNDYFFEPYASLGTVSNPKKNTNNNKDDLSLNTQSKSFSSNTPEPAIESMGLAVFKRDKLVGTLTGIETMCHLLITNELKYCDFNIPSPINADRTIDLYISNLKNSKIDVKIINGSPFVSSKFDVSIKVLSLNDDTLTLTEDVLNKLEDATTIYLSEQIYNYYDKTAKELNSDISGIGRFAAKNFRTIDEWEKYNWAENYKNCTFKVDVKTNIKSGHLLTSE